MPGLKSHFFKHTHKFSSDSSRFRSPWRTVELAAFELRIDLDSMKRTNLLPVVGHQVRCIWLLISIGIMVSSKVPDGIRPQSSFFFVSLDKESGVFFNLRPQFLETSIYV